MKFNTYLNYSYRFGAVWVVVTFSLLGPLMHILFSHALSHIHRTEYGIKMSHKIRYLTMSYGCESLLVKK